MTSRNAFALVMLAAILTGCATTSDRGTLSQLEKVSADVDDVLLDDSLARAAQSYRRYLEETPENELTPEAMRRLADLQIEQEYGVIGGGNPPVEMAAPETGTQAKPIVAAGQSQAPAEPLESDQDFERRASRRQDIQSDALALDSALPDGSGEPIPAGPREAIDTYRKILEGYPDYERNDQVLYQMSRAYDEIGQPDEAMAVMDRLVAEYPYSKYVDEVYFRRGEYFFIRKRYLDSENSYLAIVNMGDSSSYYELALYKLGWALYKQEFYEEALHRYIAMLDYRLSIGHDFDATSEDDAEHRIQDTFRVISLSFSNLGGPEVVDDYFSEFGERSYADKIYRNLGEFYFAKLRYEDAASVYKSFIGLNPFHKASPHFGMRVVEIYEQAGFPQLVVASKKEFATNYALDSDYWTYFSADESPEVVGFLKTNLTDLANHYHALYQDEGLVDDQPANFVEASHWYRQFLQSFPTVAETPQINYQLADLLLENGNHGEAAREYEQTAYEYGEHERAPAAGYAAIYAHRENLKSATGALRMEVMNATVASSLRFADTFPEHEQAPVVLGAAADDLYEMKDLQRAIDTAQKLIIRYPDSDTELLRSAWAVVANSSIDLADYENAEHAYASLLALTPADDEARPSIVDGLAASIYKQGEQANLLEDYRTAASHFLRIKAVAPTSEISSAAEYDAAAALMKLQDWSSASSVLEEFRVSHPEHELHTEATKQLAFIYREDGQLARSAAEHERIAAEAEDTELRREALLTAGELYDEAKAVADTIRVYSSYVAEYPRPLDIAMETRTRLAEIYQDRQDHERYYDELHEIVALDRDAGEDRSDRSRYLAAEAALVLAEQDFRHFAELRLTQPFEERLAEKQQRMDIAMAAFENIVAYEVADMTAAATFYIAEIYQEFSSALLTSERPSGLSQAEIADYELVIEEEAFPFEERAIEVHEANFELVAAGIYNPWVQRSLDKLAVLMPGRYAKNEISSGFVGSIDSYAYQMPVVPRIKADEQIDATLLGQDEAADSLEAAVQPAAETEPDSD